jgi:hypothetical protein
VLLRWPRRPFCRARAPRFAHEHTVTKPHGLCLTQLAGWRMRARMLLRFSKKYIADLQPRHDVFGRRQHRGPSARRSPCKVGNTYNPVHTTDGILAEGMHHAKASAPSAFALNPGLLRGTAMNTALLNAAPRRTAVWQLGHAVRIKLQPG